MLAFNYYPNYLVLVVQHLAGAQVCNSKLKPVFKLKKDSNHVLVSAGIISPNGSWPHQLLGLVGRLGIVHQFKMIRVKNYEHVQIDTNHCSLLSFFVTYLGLALQKNVPFGPFRLVCKIQQDAPGVKPLPCEPSANDEKFFLCYVDWFLAWSLP